MGHNNMQTGMRTTRASRLFAFATAAVFALAFSLCCAAALAPAQALAADGYGYTVRVWGGNQGTVDGKAADVPAEYSATYGQTFRLDKNTVALNDGSKYYVKGFRLSGQDDLHSEAFTVTEDMDFVVAYGVQGDVVPYTINFVEYETGNVLADPVTYYGNVGDKPVVAFEYIDGYRPRYRNITGTLTAEGNEFTFEYIALAEGETEDGGTTTTVITPATPATTGTTTAGAAAGTGTGAAAATGTGAAANAAGAAGAAAGGQGADADANAGGDNAQAGADADQGAPEAVAPPATEEILDTDNPLAQSASSDGNPVASILEGASTDMGIPTWVFPLAGGLVVAAAILMALLFYRRRRNEEEAE